jgi:hypothetical protein
MPLAKRTVLCGAASELMTILRLPAGSSGGLADEPLRHLVEACLQPVETAADPGQRFLHAGPSGSPLMVAPAGLRGMAVWAMSRILVMGADTLKRRGFDCVRR